MGGRLPSPASSVVPLVCALAWRGTAVVALRTVVVYWWHYLLKKRVVRGESIRILKKRVLYCCTVNVMCDALTISSSAIGTAGLRVDLKKRCHDDQQHEKLHDVLSVYWNRRDSDSLFWFELDVTSSASSASSASGLLLRNMAIKLWLLAIIGVLHTPQIDAMLFKQKDNEILFLISH